jgi:hypothetical protein
VGGKDWLVAEVNTTRIKNEQSVFLWGHSVLIVNEIETGTLFGDLGA